MAKTQTIHTPYENFSLNEKLIEKVFTACFHFWTDDKHSHTKKKVSIKVLNHLSSVTAVMNSILCRFILIPLKILFCMLFLLLLF